jgi:hypothetical protein
MIEMGFACDSVPSRLGVKFLHPGAGPDAHNQTFCKKDIAPGSAVAIIRVRFSLNDGRQ